jgi:RNAse (barnase) inhibitor barstar
MIEFTDAVPPDAAAVVARGGSPAHDHVAVVRGGWHKADAIGQFGQVLGFPEWFGHNLDALADLLPEHVSQRAGTDGGWWLVWVPSTHLISTHPADYARIVEVLAEASEAAGVRVTVVGSPPTAHHPGTDPAGSPAGS